MNRYNNLIIDINFNFIVIFILDIIIYMICNLYNYRLIIWKIIVNIKHIPLKIYITIKYIYITEHVSLKIYALNYLNRII